MAAMKPRTGDGPLEVTKEGRGIVMRVPLEGGGRLVVELSAQEASDLGDALKAAAGCPGGLVRRGAAAAPPPGGAAAVVSSADALVHRGPQVDLRDPERPQDQ